MNESIMCISKQWVCLSVIYLLSKVIYCTDYLFSLITGVIIIFFLLPASCSGQILRLMSLVCTEQIWMVPTQQKLLALTKALYALLDWLLIMKVICWRHLNLNQHWINVEWTSWGQSTLIQYQFTVVCSVGMRMCLIKQTGGAYL